MAGLLDAMNDPVMAGAMGLLSAAGPSRMPVSMGQALGAGYGEFQQAQNMQAKRKFMEMQMQQEQMQMQEMQRRQQQAQAIRDLASRSVLSPQQQAIGAGGPTQAAADMIPGLKPKFDTEGFLGGMMGIDPLQALQLRTDMTPKPFKLGPEETLFDSITYKPLASGAPKADSIPSAIKEYQFAVGQGYKGTFDQWDTQRKAAGRPATPFFQFLPTPSGYAVGDARSGRIAPASIDGKPILRPQDDPALQGRIAGAKEDATTRAGAEAKRDVTMAGLPGIIAEAESILSAKGKSKPTSSVVGAGIDALGGVVGYSPDGAEQAAKLQAIGGQLVMKMPRMEGPQSNLDQQLYREMAGEVGNPMKPVKQRLAALDAIKTLNKKYMNTGAPSAPAAGAKFLGFE